jgi:hypothetical protein
MLSDLSVAEGAEADREYRAMRALESDTVYFPFQVVRGRNLNLA